MVNPLDLFWGLPVQDTRRSVDLNICFWFDKLSPVTHCAVSSFLSVITAASQAELSCHICHLWWMTSVPSKEELRNRSHRRHRATQILLDKVDWRVFVPRTFFFFLFFLPPSEGRRSVRLHVWRDLLDRGSDINSKRVCVCSFFSRADSFVISFHILKFSDLLVLSLFMTFLHVSLTYFFKMYNLDCAANDCTALATEKQCRIVLFCKSYLSAFFNCL